MSAQPAQTDQVNLTIDGIALSVPKGTLIIRAAEKLGIQIPRFCDHPLLDPVGACRQCLVEAGRPDKEGNVRFGPKPVPACTEVVAEGMVVKTGTTSDVAQKAQDGIMEFLLINHPLDCPVCDKGGECPLQNQALMSGRAKSRFMDIKRTYAKPINISSQVLLDRERCVLCQRCTRFSNQIAGDPFITLGERGALSQISIYEEHPFESYFSGNTVQICPVGALTGAAYRFRARPFDLVSVAGTCEHCAVGCSLRTDYRRGVVLRRMAMNEPAVNEEWNCDKGRWAFTYAQLPDRLHQPLVRDEHGELQVASWPMALAAAARGLAAARDGKGVGVLPGGRLPMEDAYAWSKFARTVLRTNDVDFRARPHTLEEGGFLATHVAGTGLGVTMEDIEKAKSVLLVGLAPEEEAPVLFLRLRKANRKNKTRIFSVAAVKDRATEKMGATFVPAVPGTEAEILKGVLQNAEDLREVSEALDEGGIVLVGERAAESLGTLTAAVELAKAKGARLAWVPRRAGDRAAVEMGLLPNLLPGGRLVADAGARTNLEASWGENLPETVGRDLGRMIDAAASGELDALLVGGVDVADLPDPARAHDALEKAFVVALDLRESDVVAKADVVLPVCPFQEKDGTYINFEGRMRPFGKAIASSDMSDHRVLDLLAAEMGAYLGTRSTDACRDELAAMGPWTGAAGDEPSEPPAAAPAPGAGQAVLATWHHLLDLGRLQDGEKFLAGTARPVQVLMSGVTADAHGLAEGDLAAIGTERGTITAPVHLTEAADHVVWLPTNSPGSQVRPTLGAHSGYLVTVAKAAEEGAR